MWILIALAACIILALVATVLLETEQFGWSTLALVACVVLAQAFHVLDFLSFVQAHVVASLMYVLAYLLAGVAWSFVKWFSYLLQYRDKFREGKAAFMHSSNTPHADVPPELINRFNTFMYNRYAYKGTALDRDVAHMFKPRASSNKARIITWMSFWPFSLVGTLFNDPVRRLFHWLFNSFKAAYQLMADRILAKDVELK